MRLNRKFNPFSLERISVREANGEYALVLTVLKTGVQMWKMNKTFRKQQKKAINTQIHS